MFHSTGKKPLRCQCPSCGKQGNNKVVKTDPANYKWSDETTALFTRIAGRDISIRIRERQCEHCYTIFPSVEIPRVYLAAMINEIQKLETLADQLQMENKGLEEELASEEDETEVLEGGKAQLESENAKLNTDLTHIREGVKELMVMATELASH
jgi:hypothetical protein